MHSGGNFVIVLLFEALHQGNSLQGPAIQGHGALHVTDRQNATQERPELSANEDKFLFSSKPNNFPTCDDLESKLNQGWKDTFPSNSRYLQRLYDSLYACRENDARYLNQIVPKKRRQAEQGKPIQFMHTSMTAGSIFCDCALVQGANSPQARKQSVDCRSLEEDSPAWGDHDVPPWSVASRHHGDVHKNNCKKLAKLYSESGIDVEGNENYLPPFPLCEEFVNVLFLRDPVPRLISHLAEVLEYFSKTPDMAASYYSGNATRLFERGRGAPSESAINLLLHENVDSLVERGPLIVNEYQTRILGGYDNYFLSYGSLTTTNRTVERQFEGFPMLKAAKARLHEFDHIFILEDNIDEQLKKIFGWDCSHGLDHLRETAVRETDHLVDRLKKRWGDEEWMKLQNVNQLDHELLTEAKFLKFISGDFDTVGEPDKDWAKRLKVH